MYDGSTLPYEENLKNTKKAVAIASKYNCGVEAELGAMAAREGGEAAVSGKAAGEGVRAVAAAGKAMAGKAMAGEGVRAVAAAGKAMAGEGVRAVAAAGKAMVGKGRPFAPTGPVYTDPDEAVEFCKETKIDALAPSFGTAHGIYKSKPILDFDRVKEISIRTRLPLVMHGGSGVSPEDYRKGIECGLRKINYYSYMAKAGTKAVIDKLQAGNVLFFHDLALAAQKAMEEDVEKAMRVFAGL
jgi:fructose-bisphosphate aldolase class II